MPRKPKLTAFARRGEQLKRRRMLKKMLALSALEMAGKEGKEDWQRCYDRVKEKGNVIDFEEIELENIGFTGKLIGLFSPDGEPLAYKKVEVGMSGREETTLYKVEPPVKAT